MPTISFKLNNVKKGDKLFDSMDIQESSKSIEEHFKSLNPDLKPLQFETGEVNHSIVNAKIKIRNSFIATALTAYNHHLPLEWTPDDIWTLITFGVAQHLGDDADLAETYRKVFVEHEGKKELKVDGTGIVKGKNAAKNKSGWPTVISGICNLIKENTKTDVADIIMKPFSTSGPTEITVYHCMLMETMKIYFDYNCVTTCGIPEVILHGSVDDWQSIMHRLEVLNKIFPTFSWYLNRVSDHVAKLLSAAKGDKPNLEWWNAMILVEGGGSGVRTELSGWLGEFFAYIYCYGQRSENTGPIDFDALHCPAVTLTDFKLKDIGTEYNMKLCGGFIGVSQNKITKAVRPAIGWITYYVTKLMHNKLCIVT